MKGIILAGGIGSRLSPLTTVANKSLLPMYNKPMIHYPIETLVKSGIKEIMLVCGENPGRFVDVLGDGSQFDLDCLYYAHQKEPLGIAHALAVCESWAKDDNITVLLGDNILQNPVWKEVSMFGDRGESADIFLSEVEHPEWYGVVEMDGHKIKSIEEKPKTPKSNLISIGLYMYNNSVWDRIRGLKPSARGELEITDLNKTYLEEGKLKAFNIHGDWLDCGESFDVYLKAQDMVAKW